LFVEERRRLKIISKVVVRAAQRRRGRRFTEFELRQIAAIRKDLGAKDEAAITPPASSSPSRVFGKSAPCNQAPR
jgi:hypothetical protein